MDHVEKIRLLLRAGRISEALESLSASKAITDRLSVDVLRATLLEASGQYHLALPIAQKLLSSRRLSAQQQSMCEFVVARIFAEEGSVQAGIDHYYRAALFARDANDGVQEFRARAKLFELFAYRTVNVVTLGPMLADLRGLTMRLGDPESTTELHLVIAGMDANRGLFSTARRHVRIAREIGKNVQNPYLDATAELIEFGICILQSDYEEARVHGAAAVELSKKSERAYTLRGAQGNLGNWYYAIGDLENASHYLETAAAGELSAGLSHNTTAALESLSRVRLAQNRLDESRELLDRIDGSVETHHSYTHRWSELTRALLLARQDRLPEAVVKADLAVALAREAGDQLLENEAKLASAEFRERSDQLAAALTLLESTVPGIVGSSPELFAHAEQTFACALIRAGEVAAAESHRARAKRLCATIGSITAGRTLDDQWAEACNAAPPPQPTIDSPAAAAQRATRAAVQAIASAVAHSSRPRIAADELEHVLAAAGCVERSSVESRPPADAAASPAACTADRFLRVGRHKEHAVGVSLCRKKDADSVATVASVEILAQAIEELVRARAEREERATLWPVDELPIEGDSSILTGHMRKQINFAQKIAQANVNVLITGQSGTGKEVVARAIHNFSDRAKKPFVPFNCTAVPRDLLESQLFGHRRGAFTGADRDHIGLIRSARGGTLFLDEIGELGLDLQPKLLRFLESGEMATLGDVQLQKADVRIIAATNANLEDAVQAGRFREDLFYRLNVVRLTILPLRERRDEIPNFVHHFAARAAEEFNKGRITIAEETMERLSLYRWPGNVRQLQNEVRRMVALAEPNSTLTPDAIDPDILGTLPIFDRARVHGAEISIPLKAKLNPTLARIECEMIKAALAEHGGRVDAVAKALGISRKGLYLKRQRFGL